MNAQVVEFWSEGVSCSADLYLPEGTGRRPGLVLGHGFNMTRAALEKDAGFLCRAGNVVMAIDYRTFGTSGGIPLIWRPA